MSKTLYFSKVSINSSKIYEIYDGVETPQNVMKKLFSDMKNGKNYKNVITRILNGDTRVEEYNFYLTGINKFDNDPSDVLVGAVIKTSKIFINNIDKETGKKKTKAFDSDELSGFCFYPTKEIVCFYTTNRFGYKEFCNAFEGLLNSCSMDDSQNGEYFKVKLLTNGVSLDNIKDDLKRLRNIETIRINIIPPNPNGDLLKAIREDAEERLKDMGMGRISEKSILFKSRDLRGLNSESKEISEELDKMSAIHTKLSTEESTSNGYVEVEAVSMDGTVYNTNNTKIIKYRMPDTIVGDKMFADYCKSLILKII
ncbi:hypothetical protein HMT_3 [Clostridium phage HM T]|uniref:FHA domain-containing protein n=1 Tax=Clostridium saccharoperbutylacetonicum N1-4(HMT) TaxID=931276 RepID=M1MT83_9CLOT|nr:DUF4747 family protein [Clostridium saccharoperbutylacetonicum]AMB17415.1 hypothetical protein HMT_3 [Clostridium phage HM T]AGF54767.1 hypothetical protein Cspa_c09910 [Clostridium saccharoperbutylacetonicum N1-4(HMT)]NRT58712.1 hypothetical protein [Clostridium saccharoperbutylacetonicum]NSB27901.1 hypothetical protein [Clostridium saccharoperbutylacetonicum]NSB41384.1 hypothetical protein [Clostridium saccharoperbutylacetonicum]